MTQAASDGKLSTTNWMLLGIFILVLIYPPFFYAAARHERDSYRSEAEHHQLAQENEHMRQEIQALHAELSAAHAQLFSHQPDPRDHYQVAPQPAPLVVPPGIHIETFEMEPDGKGGWIKKGFEYAPHQPEKST
jgi:hypothetical protein